ncbi:MAG: helix-turn-helix transcriptional regulator [Eubacteriales bacterium]
MIRLNTEFSRTLALLRQEKGVSQRRAAEALGISQALMSHYEKGVREPGLSFVVRVCDYYGVSSDYLLGRTLTRDGTTIQAEDLYDVSLEKDNTLKGMILATLNKKLMFNSLGLLYELLGATGNREVIRASSDYLATSIAVVFRRFHGAVPRTNPSFFAVDANKFLCGAYDMEQKACEMELVEALAEHKKERGDFPDLNHDALTEKYGPLYQSLLQNLYSNGKRVNDLLGGKEGKS